MNQSRREKKNKFRCMACNEMKLRGVFIEITRGEYKGYVVKVCRSKKCQENINERF